VQTLTTISVFALNWCRLHVEVRHRDIPAPGYADSGRRGPTLRLRNDLYCVEWGVKLYSLTHSPTVCRLLDSDTLWYSQTVQVAKKWRYALEPPFREDQTCSSVQDRLQLVEHVAWWRCHSPCSRGTTKETISDSKTGLVRDRRIARIWRKAGTPYNFVKYWPIFKLFFIFRIRRKFLITLSLTIPTHLKCVATLPTIKQQPKPKLLYFTACVSHHSVQCRHAIIIRFLTTQSCTYAHRYTITVELQQSN